MTTLINIASVASENVSEKEMQIVARWKDSKDKLVSPNNRVRAIALPADIWSSEMGVQVGSDVGATNLLRLHVLDSIADLAKSYLASICEDSMQRTQVPLEHFTLFALLSWQQDQASISGRLNGEEIKNWLASSATVRHISNLHGAKIGEAFGAQLVKLASPNHGLTPEKASKLLASVWQVEDSNSTTGLRVQMRLTAISKKNDTTEDVLASIL